MGHSEVLYIKEKMGLSDLDWSFHDLAMLRFGTQILLLLLPLIFQCAPVIVTVPVATSVAVQYLILTRTCSTILVLSSRDR